MNYDTTLFLIKKSFLKRNQNFAYTSWKFFATIHSYFLTIIYLYNSLWSEFSISLIGNENVLLETRMFQYCINALIVQISENLHQIITDQFNAGSYNKDYKAIKELTLLYIYYVQEILCKYMKLSCLS